MLTHPTIFRSQCNMGISLSLEAHGISTSRKASDQSAGSPLITHTGIQPSKTTLRRAFGHLARAQGHVREWARRGVRPGCSSPRCFGALMSKCCRVRTSYSRMRLGSTQCGRSRNSGFGSMKSRERMEMPSEGIICFNGDTI